MTIARTVLITGGAGFIGSHLVPALAPQAERIVVVDNLLEQVHGVAAGFPPELLKHAECIRGDIRDPAVWQRLADLFPDVDVVIHLASLTGTGQSMTEIDAYLDVNCRGTAAMLSALTCGGFAGLRHVVLASSRAVYGEGAYRCPNEDGVRFPGPRSAEQCRRGRWSHACESCGAELVPVATPEESLLRPSSVYGVSKLAQEGLLDTVLAPALPVTILRLQNVFGPGQSLLNPYTGVLGVFYSRIMHGQPIELFEDGRITRDFVYCTDVVRAIQEAVARRAAGICNVGGGSFVPLERVATHMAQLLQRRCSVRVTNTCRSGDIRHAAADIGRARRLLGYTPAVSLETGLAEYLAWARLRAPMSPEVAARSRESVTVGYAT